MSQINENSNDVESNLLPEDELIDDESDRIVVDAKEILPVVKEREVVPNETRKNKYLEGSPMPTLEELDMARTNLSSAMTSVNSSVLRLGRLVKAGCEEEVWAIQMENCQQNLNILNDAYWNYKAPIIAEREKNKRQKRN